MFYLLLFALGLDLFITLPPQRVVPLPCVSGKSLFFPLCIEVVTEFAFL